MHRPSHKELFGKIMAARKAVREGKVALLNQMALLSDAIDLDYMLEKELKSVLSSLLDGTTPEDYAGHRPPDRSYEEAIKGLELFAFTVESTQLKCRVYYKFALAQGILWLVSLHPDRPPREG